MMDKYINMIVDEPASIIKVGNTQDSASIYLLWISRNDRIMQKEEGG